MFKNLINKLKSVKKMPQTIGFVVLDSIDKNFKKQAFENSPWKVRQDGDTSRNLLVSSGKLRRSIRLVEANWKRVVIASDMPYAKIHNEGGKICVTAKMKKFFWARYYKTKKIYFKNLATSPKAHIIIPKRQFLGIDKSTEEAINKKFMQTIKNIFQ